MSIDNLDDYKHFYIKTNEYEMSPEMKNGSVEETKKHISFKTDVWRLALTYIQVITGKYIILGEHLIEVNKNDHELNKGIDYRTYIKDFHELSKRYLDNIIPINIILCLKGMLEYNPTKRSNINKVIKDNYTEL